MPKMAELQGSAQYRERMALPDDAILDVYLQDVSQQDATTVVGAQEITPVGPPPVDFAIPYDPKRIDPDRRYAVRATISVADQPLFATPESFPVLTQGSPDRADLLLQRADGGAAATGLAGRSWWLGALNGQEVTGTANVPHLVFDDSEGRFHGSGGCNRIGGSYALAGDAGELDIGQIVSTKMACPDEGRPTEQEFLDALARANGYRIEGRELHLTGDGVELTFIERTP
ncbi:YbaY family lipoprotein [Geminicoccus harenae]|nr:YbaY family lipoprotein [Geminicoccus harenae]